MNAFIRDVIGVFGLTIGLVGIPLSACVPNSGTVLALSTVACVLSAFLAKDR